MIIAAEQKNSRTGRMDRPKKEKASACISTKRSSGMTVNGVRNRRIAHLLGVNESLGINFHAVGSIGMMIMALAKKKIQVAITSDPFGVMFQCHLSKCGNHSKSHFHHTNPAEAIVEAIEIMVSGTENHEL